MRTHVPTREDTCPGTGGTYVPQAVTGWRLRQRADAARNGAREDADTLRMLVAIDATEPPLAGAERRWA